MRWSVKTLNSTVDDEIARIPPTLQAKLFRIMEMVENVGLTNVNYPHTRHLSGKLWEFRATFAGNIARAIYIACKGRRVIILHAFVKKQKKTPSSALKLAQKRMKGVS